MKRYSMADALYLSFFSEGLYQDVRTNWKGTGFPYLFLLLAVTWLPVMVVVHGKISEEVRREAPRYIEQVPTITIIKGEVSIDQPVPYEITDPDSGAPLLVIDTSGAITSVEQTKAPVLLTKSKLMYRQQHRAETRIYDLTAIEKFSVNQDDVSTWVEVFRRFFSIVAYPFALAGSFVYRVLQMLLYAAIGLIFVNVLKVQLDYIVVLRLASVAITPVIVLSTVRTLAALQLQLFGLMSFAVAMGYLFFAVKANAKPAAPRAPAA